MARIPSSSGFTVLLSLALTFFSSAAFVKAQGSRDYDDRYFNDRFDFTAILKVQKMEKLTDYRGTTLNPLGKISVSYTAHPRGNPSREATLPITAYEDLWYHDYAPIGCRRYRAMPSECAGFGAIRVLPTNDAGEFSPAIANATIRLLLDMNVHGCACQNVFVPRDIFGSVFTSFSHYGFYEVTTRPESPIPAEFR